MPDFKVLGNVLAAAGSRKSRRRRKARLCRLNVYISSDMHSQAGSGLRRWATFIDTFFRASTSEWFREEEKKRAQMPERGLPKNH